jgi:hypothetical protein
MGKINFTIGSIVTSINTAKCGARFKITEIDEKENSCDIVVIKRYRFPHQEKDASVYAEVGDEFIMEDLDTFIKPLGYVLKRL